MNTYRTIMISALLAMVSFANADNIIKVESPAEVPPDAP